MTHLQPLGEPSPALCDYLAPNQLRLTFTDMNPVSRGSGLEAWVVARWQGNIPDPHVITRGTYNLKGARSASTLTSEIVAGEPSFDKADVRKLVDEAIGDVLSVFFDRDDSYEVGQDEPVDESPWLLKPLLEQNAVTRLVAQGGSLKSAFALAVAITVAADTPKLLGIRPTISGPVLYLDWESDRKIMEQRVHALSKGAGLVRPPRGIRHLRMDGSLYLAQRRVRAVVAEHRPVLLIVDSSAMARGASGEGGAEDSTIRMITTLRSYGCSVFLIDHKSTEAIRRKITGGYGSVFLQNLSRMEWEIFKVLATTTDTTLVMRLEKANNIRTKMELAYRFKITTTVNDAWERAEIEQVDPASVVSFDPHSNNADKIERWLSAQVEAQPVKEIAEATGLTANQVRAVISQTPGRFENVGSATGGGSRGALWRVQGSETDEGVQDDLPVPF